MTTSSHAPTYYELLGIPENAGAEEIARAYRRKAAEWHPDVNCSPDAHETMVKLNEAREVLTDPDLKRRYDAHLKNLRAGAVGEAAGEDWMDKEGWEDLRSRARRAADDFLNRAGPTVETGSLLIAAATGIDLRQVSKAIGKLWK